VSKGIYFGSSSDLRAYIDCALGQNATADIVNRLTDEIRHDLSNRPSFSGADDWAPYLNGLNLWAMVKSWEKGE